MPKKMAFLGIIALLTVATITSGALLAGENGGTRVDPGANDGGMIAPIQPVQPGANGKVRQLAPIEQVELLVLESFPPQYAVQVTYGLPSGCATPGGHTVERDGQEIHVSVYFLHPADPNLACTMIYGIATDTVMLGSDFTPGATYILKVNDTVTSFTAQ